MYGFHNKLAWIDLTSQTVEFQPLDEHEVASFIGGSSLGAAMLARLTGPETDPLGPENPLIFLTGVFTATRIPAGSRHEVISLSPLTGIFGESNCGGSFGRLLKRAGLDGLVITGASATPVAVVVDGAAVRFRDAGDLWGSDVYTVDEKLKGEIDDPRAVTSVIGPAGENLVRVASISHDGRHTRAAGRCGLGAVMGSKKLKAVVVTSRGDLETPVANPEGFQASVASALPGIRERLELFGSMGTPGGVITYNQIGNLPIRNWRDARATEVATKTTGTTMKDTIWVRRTGCRGCPIVCGRLVEVKDGPFATDGVVEGPEYETLAAFGSLCFNDNLEAIAKANEVCNRMGLDTISTGGLVAFACECFEKGLITAADTGGLELGFGKPEAVVELVRRIARAEGELAQNLGLGVRRAAERIGGSAAEYALEVKGLEFPMHDPRFSWGQALSYCTGGRGACHLTGLAHPFELVVTLPELGYDEPLPGRQREGKAQFVIHLQHVMTLMDALISCKFSLLNNAVRVSTLREWYNFITGRDMSLDDFLAAGERGFTLKRMINNSRGISRKDDILPPRMRTLKKQGEEVDLDVPPLLPMLADYYEIRGWTEEGCPGSATVQRLGLESWVEKLLS